MASNTNNARGQGRGQQGQQGMTSQFAGVDPSTIIAIAAAAAIETTRQITEGGQIASLGGIGQQQGSQSQTGQGRGGNTGGDTSNRGFASMDPEKQREIAAEGGRASHGGGRPAGSRNGQGQQGGRRPGAPVNEQSAMQVAKRVYADSINDESISRQDIIREIVGITGSKKEVINTYISNIDRDNGGILKQRNEDARAARRAEAGNGGQGRGRAAGAQDGRRNNRPPSRAASARGGRNSGGGQGRTGTDG